MVTLVVSGERLGPELRGRRFPGARGEEGVLGGARITLHSEVKRESCISAGRRGGGITVIPRVD